ncbi:IS110 family transposase [Dactylosporangium sp. CA-092794]|uniref:IS110 family transposase n=1 Tax=Dactylosporangium sp. CA-092794 TaxID=3239929 RepID=UPI003D8A9751
MSTAWVVGVDTHTDTHTATLVDEVSAVLAQTEVPATPAGYAQVQAWAQRQIPAGQRMFWAVEGTRSHGHGLTRHLQAAGYRVVEAVKPEPARRRRGKSDPMDATHAALAAQAVERDPAARHAEPRADGRREALRMLLVTRRHDSDVRTATVNLFKSLLLGAGQLRETLRGLTTTRQVRAVAGLPDDPAADLETRVRLQALRRAAATIAELDRAIAAAEKQLAGLVKQACPGLLDQPGVGPVTAATLLTVWSHHGRIHSEAAFAAIGGISPLPASSGRVVRHRLNRGGDRALNTALHTIVTARRRMKHPPTSDYITRRTTEGLSNKEILRCLKRYAIRQLYRFLEANAVDA